MNIRIFFQERLPASVRRRLRLFSRACRAASGPRARRTGGLSLIFVTNTEIRRINKRHLRHDYATDVIAFPHHHRYPRKPTQTLIGDIYISVDQAREQARELGHSHLEELLVLAVHGTLHLMGYDDHRPDDRRRMFARQARILKRLGFSGKAGLDR